MLVADLDAPGKQRHTAQTIFDRLVDEHQAIISYSTVRQYVKARRTEIAIVAGRAPVEVFVPQEHAPGAEAEVDFVDVWADLAGVRTRCCMFAYRLSHAGKAVHRVYLTCGQEAFLERHIEAFNALGGVPTNTSGMTTSPPRSRRSPTVRGGSAWRMCDVFCSNPTTG